MYIWIQQEKQHPRVVRSIGESALLVAKYWKVEYVCGPAAIRHVQAITPQVVAPRLAPLTSSLTTRPLVYDCTLKSISVNVWSVATAFGGVCCALQLGSIGSGYTYGASFSMLTTLSVILFEVSLMRQPML